MTKCYVVKLIDSKRIVCVVKEIDELKKIITDHYDKFIGKNGIGECLSIYKQRDSNSYKVNTVYTDSNDNLHSTQVYTVELVDLW